MLTEQLEQRQLLIAGPLLIGVQPNNSDLILGGDVRTESPRELTFRFDDAQVIDPGTLDGIRLTSAGGDGSFGLASAQSDFGSLGKANLQIAAVVPEETFTIQVAEAVMAAGTPPAISTSGTTISITLNTNPASPTTADELINEINSSVLTVGRIRAQLNGGLGTAPLGVSPATGYSPITLDATHDQQVIPGSIFVGDTPNENEVTVRFAETLKDDHYRIEIFGFDDPNSGVVGLRNANGGELYQPQVAGTRLDTIDFRLDLGPQVISVVPQPVLRVGGQLVQQRDTIVVYFDNDKLLVENDALGRPTSRSVENPDFYKLIFTNDTVRNTDDAFFPPQTVSYNAATNSATLKFNQDIDTLPGGLSDTRTFRLRIGSRESAPFAPGRSEAAATAITDLNTDGAVKLRFTAREVGEDGNGVQVVFVNSGSGTPLVTSAGRVVTVDMGRPDLTAQELVDLLQVSSAASALFSVGFEAGSNPATVVGNAQLSFSPLTLVGLGSSFDTAADIGVLGSANQLQTSLVLASAIDPEPFILDLPGASDDAAHRTLPQNLAAGFEDHVNQSFGADSTDGITTIFYNFKENYSTDATGLPLVNAVTDQQKQRAREVLSLWANYIGVQFIESPDLGITIATGQLAGLVPRFGTQIQQEAAQGFGVRIDPSFDSSLLIMSANNPWNNEYGADYTRNFAAAVGMLLGLEHAGDLPETTLMRLDPTFLAGSGPLVDLNDNQLNASDERYEPILPGNQDILHAQYLHRPDGTDIDLYRFEVDFGGVDRVGLLTAETYAQRLRNSSSLDTNIQLYKQKQASATTNLGVGNNLQVRFEAIADGALGNQLQIIFTQTDRTDTSEPRIVTFPNAIGVDLNSNPAFETSAQQVIDALQQSSAVQRLVMVELVKGDPSVLVGANDLPQNPVVLTGGEIELISQNDDYFSTDSLLRRSLGSGIYYLGVSASGNDEYNGSLTNSGFGGQSQGDYELRLTFRAQVDTTDTIQDIDELDPLEGSVGFDGDGDGNPGGTYNFWFQTRPLHRSISINSAATSDLEGRVISVVGANGVLRDFEFDSDSIVSAGRVAINYSNGLLAGDLATRIAFAINGRPELGVAATANGTRLTLVGERSITIDPQLTLIDVQGKTIFVDKSAGPAADGSLARPFNNIAGVGVPNAFASTHPGDIVRIVGNGGADSDISTIDDNFAYEIGVGLLPGQILSDGLSMDVPRGVTAMIDAGAVFKLRQAAINVGSTNLNIDRSGSSLQVLGAPLLLDVDGNAVRHPDGSIASGNVFFTSWLDETTGLDTYLPTTNPAPGDWGGISFRRDVDVAAGRSDLEDEGIFLRYVNHADVRYGGGTVLVDSVQQVVNSIQMLETRPTVTDNLVQFGADAAMSALPNSFEETNFHEPRFQADGSFTSDYDRVGPDLQRNKLVNNSLNGLFIRVDTPADGSTQTLTVAGRLDDTDIVHLVTENLTVMGNPGGSLLDNTAPDLDLISFGPALGGSVLPGQYNYKVTFVDRNGYESIPSNPSLTVAVPASSDAISIAGLPAATGDFTSRKLYRSGPSGEGPYRLVADLDRLTSTFLDTVGDQDLGSILDRDRVEASGITSTPVGGGTLNGAYNYRIVMVDAGGRDGLASNATANVTVAPGSGVQLDQIPLTLAGYVGRRIYRSANGGTAPYVLVAELLDSSDISTTTIVDDGSDLGAVLGPDSFGIKRPRLNASLVIDPGNVIKLEAARIEATFGANILAEGLDGVPIVFTSKLDDAFGAGGTFDTNNNAAANLPSPRDWGGIYMAPTSTLSVDHARFSFGGGVTKIEGTFRAFNTIEIQQAEARIANSVFENNADGFGGQGPGTRLGRLSNAQSTIFVRGAQPTIIGNSFIDNAGSAIEIDLNSMTDDVLPDLGRQTGAAERNPEYLSNRGPLIRDNRFDGNDLNGLEIRAFDFLTTASVWDDTDIVHVVTEEIFVGNVQHEGGLRLQSAPSESLVVKFDGYGSDFNRYMGAGLTAFGELSTGKERVGGSLHVVGQPGFPVILTSLRDDTVGAGLKPDGNPQNDTNNDGIGSIPQDGDWRGLLLDQYSNDRNVALALEVEDVNAAAPGPNGTTTNAQVLGDLASSTSASNENRRLGFIVEGVLSQSEDVDVYSFSAAAGTEIWLDVDHTKTNLDTVIELLDANGSLLARSDDSTAESLDPSLIVKTSLIDDSAVNPLPSSLNNVRMTSGGQVKEDGTTNSRDPGMRVRLPGATGTRSTFYFRVRSSSIDQNNFSAGLSSGSYQVQVRMREAQEWAGSSVNFADIRYATNGVHLRGLPGSSPLIGEAAEDESADATFNGSGLTYANNGTAIGDGTTTQGFVFASVDEQVGNRPQYIGNILDTDKGGISVAGELNNTRDVDFYHFEVRQNDIVGGLTGGNASVVFDIDYADGFARPDTSINIFRREVSFRFGEQYRLIYSGDSSNIAEDQPRPLSVTDAEDLSRGSAGNKDAYVGPIALPEGDYLVGISSAGYQPRAKILNPFNVSPVNSVLRIVDTGFQPGVTTADPPVVQNFLPATSVGPTGELVSAPFDMGSYAAEDLPAIYLDYTHAGGTFEISVRDGAGNESLVGTTNFNPNVATLQAGSNSIKIPLVDTVRGLYDFSGQNDLQLVFRSANPATNMDRVIIGFGERGEQIGAGDEQILLPFAFLGRLDVEPTRTFSLETYDAFFDQPAVNFDYEIFQGNLDVFVIDQFGNQTRVATSDANNAGPNEVVLTAGSPQNATVDLSFWADQPGITIEFRTRDEDSSTSVSNVHIELADGSRVFSDEPNSTYTDIPVSSTTILTGEYQLEVRMGEVFFDSNRFGAPRLTQTFDTNDRFAEQVTLVAPAGADLTDGDRFEVSDGGTAIVFEFNSTGGVGLGNIPVPFTAADPVHLVAQRIRDAINNPNVQSRLLVRAASAGGIESGSAGEDARINLFGKASVRTIAVANPAAEVQVIEYTGSGDVNIQRDQGQIIIQNSYIREPRDYGVWSEPAGRLRDPRDLEQNNGFFGFFNRTVIQDKPELSGTQAVRNLPVFNNAVDGGMLPGLVVQNNVLEEGGLGGVNVLGESPIWMISPLFLPLLDNDPTMNNANNPDHFGALLDDGDYLVIDSDRTRLHFEFEDIAGAGTGAPNFGSGQVEGDGVRPDSVPVYYREEGATPYHRPTPNPLVAFATNGLETMHALRDAILGSIFVTNGTTQQVRATIGESLLGPDPNAPATEDTQFYPEYYNRPAVYLEGVTNVQFLNSIGNGNPFDIRPLDLGAAPQPHARIVNNTIVGKDGRASFNGESPVEEANDTIASAVQTWQGTSHNPLSYDASGSIGDVLSGPAAQDVDIYQFKLGLGERAIIDVDSTSGLDSVLQIFNSQGIAQSFSNGVGTVLLSDNAAAPGETLGLDPYADFTATLPGVYYAAISSIGNVNFDPLSLASRTDGLTTGSYDISVGVRHLQDFVITAQDASAYSDGDTFTIFGVPDIAGTGSSGRTFEFTFGIGASVQAGNIPININADWRFPDVAKAIAKAINEGDNGQHVITNAQTLANGDFGDASPLPPAHAVALGGLSGVIDAPFNDIVGDRALFLDQFVDNDLNLVDGFGLTHLPDREIERLLNGPFDQINPGLELFTRRNDGFLITTTTSINNGRPITRTTSMGNLGIGHDRNSTTPLSQTSVGDGTTEKFVVVKNAAYIDGNGSILVDPDENENNNLDQLLPETGVLASRGASPTILNNVFFNLQTPVINEESRRFPLTGGPAPYGTNNPNAVLKPGEVVLGGSIFQYYEPGIANVRFGTGIESVPTNVPNTALDLNFDIAAGVDLFENAQGSNYLPSALSPLIDSSVDSLPERSQLNDVKGAVGIAASPVLTPNFDLVGQLRVDDPDVAPPSGQGLNVFKDRGALDRADFVGPAAILLDPIDNDSLGIDQDSAVSVVQLNSGVYPEFRIQLADGNEPSNPFRGLGIDDNTVVNSLIDGLRSPGAAVVLFENGRMLTEGVDYTFAYNSTRDEIVLTPLAGVWRNDHVYEISINNKDRFAVVAPAGDQVSDGDTFVIRDTEGGEVVYEFDSGYRLQVPNGLAMNIPLAGGAFGGIADGDRFSIIELGTTTTFEFDRNGNTLAGNLPIVFEQGASQVEIADAVFAAIQSSSVNVIPVRQSDGTIFLGATAGVRLDTSFAPIGQPAATLALKIPDLGPRPGGITDGQTFTISDGRRTITFEYDSDGNVQAGNQAVDFSSALTASDLAIITQAALANSALNVDPTIVASELVHIGLSPNGTADVSNSLLNLVGVSRALADGERFTVNAAGGSATFEFDTGDGVSGGNIAIPISLLDTESTIGSRIATSISTAGLGLTPVHVGGGNVAIGGVPSDSINVASAPALRLFGQPGVQTGTQIEIFGPLLLHVPARGAGDLIEDSIFSITNNGVTAIFEFDSDFSGPSVPGNLIIRYDALSTQDSIANEIAFAINNAGLGVTATNNGNGEISLGILLDSQVSVGITNLTTSRGVVSDGETFTISDGNRLVTFEFENVDFGNGFALGNTPILFSSSTSTPQTVVATMQAVIAGAGLGLSPTTLSGGILALNDTPKFTTDTRGAPSLLKSGVPGGSKAVFFIQDPSFTGEDMKRSILEAINGSADTNLIAANRGGDTFFVENAVSISPEIDSYFIRGVADVAGNLLKPNRITDETAFTILMPGVELDYGDAPDPFTTTLGRYATQHVNNGARHVLGGTAILGAVIDGEIDGQPTALADGDASDDGVVMGTNLVNTSLVNDGAGAFNRNTFTTIDVTLAGAGFVDAWIDFNADGDWDDPGEQILRSAEFPEDRLTQSFQVTVPATSPIPNGVTQSYARFRSSSTGGLLPTGLANDGEVEDYIVTILPGTPPTANNDNYALNEDSSITTTDATGGDTPSFTIDDGFAANDTDPEGGPLWVEIVDPPTVGTLTLTDVGGRNDGTFSYTPPTDFNGVVTFTYRVNDGFLNSNNIGTVTITVREVNDTPIVNDDAITIDEDEVLNVDQSVLLQNDSAGSDANEDSQTMTITSVQAVSAQSGTVNLSNGRVIYIPPSNFSGTDTFTYTVTDNGTTGGVPAPLSATATVTITIRDKNDPPITVPKSISTAEDTQTSISLTDLLAGDLPGPADEAGQQIRFIGIMPASSNGGVVEVSGSDVLYTPPMDFVGTDTFFYQVEDNGSSGGVGDPQRSTGTVSVSVVAVNDAPRIANPFGQIVMQEDDSARIIDLSTVFTDPDIATNADMLSYAVIGNSNTGMATPSISGNQLELQLVADQNGQALIEVQATDLAGQSITDTLTLSVTPVNDAPRLVQALDDLTVDEDAAPIDITLSPAFFFDPDVGLNGDQLTFALVSNSNPLLVTPEIAGDTLRLTLGANQSGVAVISVSATDGIGQTISDTFNLVVRPINDIPETTADSYIVKQGQTLTTTDPRGLVGGTNDDGVLANDRDPEGSALSAVIVNPPQFASQFGLNSDGTFTYKHDFSQGRTSDSFTYRASDGSGESVETVVTIEIDEPPPPPHQNPIRHMDVNADGFISPIDALLVINFLNTNVGDGSVENLPSPPPFRDVNGDNFITPIDALIVINELNSGSGGEGEGDGSLDSLAAAFGSQQFVGPTGLNTPIGMRTVKRDDDLTYGPVLPAQEQVFGEIDQNQDAALADTSWLDRQNDDDDDDDSSVDLALASMLGELDESGDA